MFPAGKPISEQSGKLVSAWAAGGSAPQLSETELDDLCMTMDVKSMPELETAFGNAYTKAKKIHDEKAMKKLKAVYDGQRTALAAGPQ